MVFIYVVALLLIVIFFYAYQLLSYCVNKVKFNHSNRTMIHPPSQCSWIPTEECLAFLWYEKIMCYGFEYNTYVLRVLLYQICKSFTNQLAELVVFISSNKVVHRNRSKGCLVDFGYVDSCVVVQWICSCGLCSVPVQFLGDNLIGNWSYDVLSSVMLASLISS